MKTESPKLHETEKVISRKAYKGKDGISRELIIVDNFFWNNDFKSEFYNFTQSCKFTTNRALINELRHGYGLKSGIVVDKFSHAFRYGK